MCLTYLTTYIKKTEFIDEIIQANTDLVDAEVNFIRDYIITGQKRKYRNVIISLSPRSHELICEKGKILYRFGAYDCYEFIVTAALVQPVASGAAAHMMRIIDSDRVTCVNCVRSNKTNKIICNVNHVVTYDRCPMHAWLLYRICIPPETKTARKTQAQNRQNTKAARTRN